MQVDTRFRKTPWLLVLFRSKFATSPSLTVAGSETLQVLDRLSVDIAEGQFLGLMGPSGSGKTTLLNLIAGLDTPDSGSIEVAGSEISRMSESQLAAWRTRNIGFVFQFYHLLPVLSAFDNVELPLLLLPMSAAQRRQQVTTALEIVGLQDRMSHLPDSSREDSSSVWGSPAPS